MAVLGFSKIYPQDHIYAYTCMYVCIYIYIDIHVCVYTYIYIYMCIYIYIYIYIYLYIHTCTLGNPVRLLELSRKERGRWSKSTQPQRPPRKQMACSGTARFTGEPRWGREPLLPSLSRVLDRGTFWVLPLTYSARVYLFPQSVKINYFCSGPANVGMMCVNIVSKSYHCLQHKTISNS